MSQSVRTMGREAPGVGLCSQWQGSRAFCGDVFFGFRFLGEGGYFEGLGEVVQGKVSKHANEPLPTSHFQILKHLKGVG